MTTYIFFSYETTKLLTLILLLVFFFIDSIVVFVMLKQNFILDYWYFNWHKRFGLLKMTALKILFLVFQVYLFLNPALRRSDPILLVWFYILVVLIMLFKFIKEKWMRKNRSTI